MNGIDSRIRPGLPVDSGTHPGQPLRPRILLTNAGDYALMYVNVLGWLNTDRPNADKRDMGLLDGEHKGFREMKRSAQATVTTTTKTTTRWAWSVCASGGSRI